MGNRGFKDLIVWQKAKDLAVNIYRLTEHGRVTRDYWLCDQIRRSAVSIASNVAEGDERDTDKDAVRFFYIAKGSVAELRTHIQIATESGQMEKALFEDLDGQCERLGKMIGGLIRVRKRSLRP